MSSSSFRTKHGTDRLTTTMRNAGHSVQRLHSGLYPAPATRALEVFARAANRILIATDIAARGIDVTGIDRVVNFDLPETQRTTSTGSVGRHDWTPVVTRRASPTPASYPKCTLSNDHLGQALPAPLARFGRQGSTRRSRNSDVTR